MNHDTKIILIYSEPNKLCPCLVFVLSKFMVNVLNGLIIYFITDNNLTI